MSNKTAKHTRHLLTFPDIFFVKAEVGNVWKPSSLWHETPKEATLLHPPLSVFCLARVSFCLSSLSLLRVMTRWNCCRERCSGVNWSVPARLKPTEVVARSSACQVTRGQCQHMRNVTCFNSQSALGDLTCCWEAQHRAAVMNTRSRKWAHRSLSTELRRGAEVFWSSRPFAQLHQKRKTVFPSFKVMKNILSWCNSFF